MYATDLNDIIKQSQDYRKNRDYRDAIELFRKNWTTYEKEARFVAAYALTLADAGMIRSAVQLIDKAVSQAPDDKSVLIDAARMHLLAGRPRSALGLCQKLRESGKPTAILHGTEGDAYYQSGLLEEAANAYREAISLSTKTSDFDTRLKAVEKRITWTEIARTELVETRQEEKTTSAPSDAGSADDLSIVIPTWCEEKHIGDLLRCLTKQTVSGFDVHVVDNASDDRTLEIVETYRDALDIKVHTNATNLGENANTNRAFALSDRPFVLALKTSDLFSRNYVEKLYTKIRSVETIAFCHGGIVYLDENAEVSSSQTPVQSFQTDISKPFESAMIVARFYGEANQFFGMYRKSALDRAGPVPFVFGGDHVHMFKVALLGDIAFVDEPLYFRRVGENQRNQNNNIEQQIQRFSLDGAHNIKKDSIYSSLDFLTPYIDMIWAHIEAAARAPLEAKEKSRIMESVPGFFGQRFGASIEDDIRRIKAFIDENEDSISKFKFAMVRNCMLERLCMRVIRGRQIMPANPALAPLQDQVLKMMTTPASEPLHK